MPRSKYHPALIRATIEHAKRDGREAAHKAAGIPFGTLQHWMTRHHKSGGTWPTDQDVASWSSPERTNLLPANDPRHGTNSGYVAGCSCTPCREAHANYKRQRRTRLYLAQTDSLMTPSLGSKRRIQALIALGYSFQQLDREMGYRPQPGAALCLFLYYQSDAMMTVERAHRIAEMYERLCMKPPPSHNYTETNRRKARERGWAPPLAWNNIDDPDEQPMGIRDTTRTLTTTEHRFDVLHDIDARAGGLSEACRVLDVSIDALEKWCSRHDLSDLFNRLRARETAVFEYRNGATGAA